LSAGCAVTATAPADAPAEITDQLNRTVKLDRSPQRIISLAPSNTEILYALGLADRVVGVTDFDNYPPEVKEKESIGGFSTPNLEKVVSLSPDLVVAAPIHEKQVIPQLEQKGIAVLALAPRTLDEVMAAITMVGKATATEKAASELTSQMAKRIKAVTDKTDKLDPADRPKVMYIVWHDPLKASARNTFHDELINKAGGLNVFGDLSDYPSVSLEAVIEASPAVMLAGIGMGQGQDAPLQFALNDERLRDVDARRNNRVYGVNSDTAGRAGPRIVDVLEEFAKLIHPELFK
jgi:iron complex transport system substrate-binding protein